ncbi:endoglucanase [Clostridia bacterium]|nr:endoglucanase [Clostridia bacterium]
MKKILALGCALLVLLAACSGAVTEESPSPSVSESPSAAASPSAEPPKLPVFEGTAEAFTEYGGLEFIRLMGAGWNLGNTLDASGGMGIESETAWGNPKTTAAMIQVVADAGFKTIRIPTTWNRHFTSAPEYKIDGAWMDRVQEVVDYAIDAGLYVILNMHHETDWQYPDKANSKKGIAAITATWSQIASRFGGYDEHLLFETMNEPRLTGTNLEWNGGDDESREIINIWNREAVKAIRATGGNNDKRWVMCPPYAAATTQQALKGFKLPDDPYVILSAHAYKPYNFALNTNTKFNTFDPANPQDTNEIDNTIRTLVDNFISKGIPVVIGENGCVNKENLEARTAWAAYFSGKAAEAGIPNVFWDNGVQLATNGGEGFGLLDRRGLVWWYPEIAEAFAAPYNTGDA